MLLGVVPSCGWRAGPVSVSGAWQVGSVQGAAVEPGIQASARGELGRALVQRGVQGSGTPVHVVLRRVAHTPSQASSAGQVGWRTEVQLELTAGRCRAEAQAEQRWSAPTAAEVVAAREAAVDGALSVAIGLALDRLLVQEECS